MIFQNKPPDEKSDEISESSLVIPENPTHYKNQFVLSEVLRELGLRTKRSNRDDIWAALSNSLRQDEHALSPSELLACIREIQARVLAELLEKNALFKDLINKDAHCPVFEDYVDDVTLNEVRDKGIKEDHYILMAFAIAYKVNVVVIRAGKSSLLYEPEKPETYQSVWFLTFIEPNYYYATTAESQLGLEENVRLKFLTDQVFQTDLLNEIQDGWESRGCAEYKRKMESMLPQELPYQSPGRVRNISGSDLDSPGETGLRLRAGRPKSERKQKIEHFALMETA